MYYSYIHATNNWRLKMRVIDYVINAIYCNEFTKITCQQCKHDDFNALKRDAAIENAIKLKHSQAKNIKMMECKGCFSPLVTFES